MASLDAEMEKMKFRQNYPNHWHTDLLRAPQSDPLFCCFSLWWSPDLLYYATPYAAILKFYLRFDLVVLVHRTFSENELYTMICQGIHVVEAICLVVADVEKAIAPSCVFVQRFGVSLNYTYSRFSYSAEIMSFFFSPLIYFTQFHATLQVFLCFANSVASTRFMLQDEFNLQTTKCDNCIIGFMFCLQQVACIFSCIACITGNDELQEASRVLNCCSDMVYCTVCSCMQTQHKVEMDKRDGKFGARPTAAPPVQQMSRLDQPLPPTIAYAPQSYPPPPPPQQPYGYPPPQQQPPMYPPPPLQHHGYPPPNYAPSGVGYPPPGYPR
ncbi:hypothetical protein H5410_050133 [Solanum commersonii]|uniref:Uncharacterized protein n=1 Tax=Solanum commersonii TaxID=4109 RepID=A0A9J5WUP5_SOLCO|nr:hypothetical protein H5410_050133 [Solanum commersonii]